MHGFGLGFGQPQKSYICEESFASAWAAADDVAPLGPFKSAQLRGNAYQKSVAIKKVSIYDLINLIMCWVSNEQNAV